MKRPGPNYQKIKDNYGGNRKWQTFKFCHKCGKEFGPVDRLTAKYCSRDCKHDAMRIGRKTFRKTITKARSAQSLLAYHIKAGNIIKPDTCEECGQKKRIEGAHYNYDEPLKVRWLCRSCHVKWDKSDPKNATYIIKRWEDFTGKKAELID